jgi:hypothetical protein
MHRRKDNPMTTPDADGWITHGGGPCPVAPETWVQVVSKAGAEGMQMAGEWLWHNVVTYRIFAPVTPTPPGPSEFVRQTAARIMAAMVTRQGAITEEEIAGCVLAAEAMERALKGDPK